MGAVRGTQGERLCPDCGESIRRTARRCLHCQADLSWLRYVGPISQVLALLTALVSVVGLVLPTVRQPFHDFDADFTVGSIPSDIGSPDEIAVIVENAGGRIAALSWAQITVEWMDDGVQGIDIKLDAVDTEGSYIAAASAKRLLLKAISYSRSVTLSDQMLAKLFRVAEGGSFLNLFNAKCSVRISFLAPDGERAIKTAPIDSCNRILPMLEKTLGVKAEDTGGD